MAGRWNPGKVIEGLVLAALLGLATHFTSLVSSTLEETREGQLLQQATLEAQAETDATLALNQREIQTLVAANTQRLDKLDREVDQVRAWSWEAGRLVLPLAPPKADNDGG